MPGWPYRGCSPLNPIQTGQKSIAALALWMAAVLLPATGFPVEIELAQPDGSTLKLQQSAKHLITLSPHLAELAFAAGAGAKLLATVDYSEYPDAARQLPRVGDAFRVDLERITQLKPDLVLAWDSGNPAQAVARLRSLGLPVWAIEIRQPEEIATTLEAIGRVADTQSQAYLAARAVRENISRLGNSGKNARTVTYFYQVAGKPLFTINGQHLIAQSLSRCGGINVFANQPVLAPQVSHESVIAANPEVIFAPHLPGQPDPFAKWRDWPGVRAVANDHLAKLDADMISQATPRMLEAVLEACRFLNQVR